MSLKDTQRQLVLGGGAAIGTIIVLAILVALQYVAVRNPLRWDLTRLGKYTLAAQSTKVLQSFEEKKIPIAVLAFFESKDLAAKAQVRDLLDQYRVEYPSFSYSFVDPDKERAVAVKNKIDSYPTLVIKAGEKDERITTADEETVTNALLKLLRSEVKKVYFLKGHGELSLTSTDPNGLSIAKEQIEKQNYKTAEIVLLRAVKIPEDAAMLVIAGPRIDCMDGELKLIRDYVKRGGKLLVMLNPFKSPKLAALLKEFGFETADDIVVDRMSRVLGGDYLMPVITSYVKFPITKNFSLASFFPEARSVRTTKNPMPNVTVKELAFTSPASWTISEQQLKSGDPNFDEKTGTKGPVPVMAVSTYTGMASVAKASPSKKESAGRSVNKQGSDAPEKETQEASEAAEAGVLKPVKAGIVTFGCSQFASNKFFKLQGNGELLLNTVSWLAEEENLIAIRPKSNRSEPLVLTARQSSVLFLFPVVIIPLAWFIAGIVIYLYRRRTSTA